jgi:CHRD domain
MRKSYVIGVVLVLALAAAAAAFAAFNGNFGTHLAGRNENPARATSAQGQALFALSDDGSSVHYKLIASNIENAFMAHIHMGPRTENGPIVVWLYPSTAPVPGPFGAGRHDGVLAEGTFTAANLVGPLSGHPLSDLIAAVQSGNAYVNVHTNDGVDGINTGAGDFPGGEIRGQLDE